MESDRANTGVVADSRSLTSSPIFTRLVFAFVYYSLFAITSRITRRAAASVRPLAGIETCGTILARLIVCAKVEILIAEKTSPALVTVALPGCVARTVVAPRVTDTLIAKRASPAIFTFAFAW